MKTKFTLIVILTLSIFVGRAQQAVPNGGLETWSSPYSPTGWTSIEDIIPPIAGVGLSVKDSIDKYEGTVSVKLTSQYVSLADDTVAGTLAIGTGVFGGGGPELLGTPFGSSPDTLHFAYKYAPNGVDTAGFSIQLHMAGGSNYKLQYSGMLLSTGGQWATMTVPLKQFYTDTINITDTLFLMFRSSNLGEGSSTLHPRVGSVLHIDAVSFGYAIPASGTAPDAYTMGHDPIVGHDFNFYGAVNGHSDNTFYSFVYSTDSTFASSTSTPVQNKIINSLEVVWATVNGLNPNSTYYYYVTANSINGTTNGKTMRFFSDTITPIFENAGGDVTPGMGWAQLNGRLLGFHTNLALYFEYGETPLMGKQMVPDVTNVTDSLTHYFRAYPDSLSPGKLYFERAKAISSTDTFYTDIRAFYTGTNAFTLHQILSATSVTDSSADVNGNTQGFQPPVKLKVELFNNNIGYHFHSPFDYHAPDTSLIHYQYHKSGLQPGTLYSVRYKAETWIGNFYSDGDFTTTGGTIGFNAIQADNNILVYPNPSKDLVIVEIANRVEEGDFLQLLSLNGQLMKELRLAPGQNKVALNLADITAGFYLLNIKTGNCLSNRKIVIVK